MESILFLLAMALTGQVTDPVDGAAVVSEIGEAGVGATVNSETGVSETGTSKTGGGTTTPKTDVPVVTAEKKKISITQMLRSFAPKQAENLLVGADQTLAEVVGLPGDPGLATSQSSIFIEGTRAKQTERIEAYWDLFTATTIHHMAKRHELELQTLRAGIAEPALSWQQVAAESQQWNELTRQRATAAQYQLQQMVGITILGPNVGGPNVGGPNVGMHGNFGANEALPRCSELPHCGRYNSQYATIFKERPSLAARQLHELLESEYDDLLAQANNINKSTELLHQLSLSRTPESDGELLLHTFGHLVLQRNRFVQSVGQYNKTIVRYVHLAVPGPIDTNRLVAMLIYQAPSGRIAKHPSRSFGGEVGQADSEGPVNGRPVIGQIPIDSTDSAIKTYTDRSSANPPADTPSNTVEGSWTQPSKNNLSGERSIIVTPQR